MLNDWTIETIITHGTFTWHLESGPRRPQPFLSRLKPATPTFLWGDTANQGFVGHIEEVIDPSMDFRFCLWSISNGSAAGAGGQDDSPLIQGASLSVDDSMRTVSDLVDAYLKSLA